MSHAFKKSLFEEDFRDLKKSFVLKVTITGILLTVSILLVSCQTQPRRLPFPVSPSLTQSPTDRQDPLYIKREMARIKPRESGSESGSIYADSRRPLNLFSDDFPSMPGDYLTVVIPDSLQFKPQVTKDSKDSKDLSQARSQNAPDGKDSKDANNSDDEILRLLRTDTKKIANSNQVGIQPLKEFKVQIVGIENGGKVFLKGTKSFSGTQSANRPFELQDQQNSEYSVTFTASIPQTALKSKLIDASELSQIEISSVNNGRPSLYQSDGWDQVISRKLAGFSPDIESDLAGLRQFEDRLTNQQSALTDRYRGLRQEQSRFKKEQQNFLDKMQRLGARNDTAPNPALNAERQNAGTQTTPQTEVNTNQRPPDSLTAQENQGQSQASQASQAEREQRP